MIPVKVDVPKGSVLPDMFDWCYNQKLSQGRDWQWKRPDWNETKYTFLFREEKYAIMFNLRWL